MISCNPYINFGQPNLVGRRLTVYDIVTKIFYEGYPKVATEDYGITCKEAREAVTYCSKLECQNDNDLVHFCYGCILRTIAEGTDFKRNDFFEIKREGQNLVLSYDGKVVFAGTLDELEEAELGKVAWLIANEVLHKLPLCH